MTARADACALDQVDPEDVIRGDHGGGSFAVCRRPDGAVFATDGSCTHEKGHPADGPVIDDAIERPRHDGRLNHRSGALSRAPVSVALAASPARIGAGRIGTDPGGAA